MEHLIADSGIQFIVKEIEFNPSEPLILASGKALKYSFSEIEDFLEEKKVFSMLYYNSEQGNYIPVDELINFDDALVRKSNGREEIDETGMVVMKPGYNTALLPTYSSETQGVYNINSLLSFRVKNPSDSFSQVPAFELLLDKWLPMPMFKKEVDGITTNAPYAWCRMKMSRVGTTNKKGLEKFRLVWAFDTQLAKMDEISILRPTLYDEEGASADYCMCNKADVLLEFLPSNSYFHAFSDYIASLFGVDDKDSKKYKAFYIYFLNYIRLSGASPEVTLHKGKHDIFVDLVLDIGNSRTCGILFEEGDFRRGKMLELRDMSNPWVYYENKTFDMRIVFRKADFGNDIILDEEMFQWKSFVRLGEEARRLVYRSLEEDGLSEKTNNYSSPKRYLWDTKMFEGQWENLVTTDDPFNVLLSNEVSIPTLSGLFKSDGQYCPDQDSREELLDILDLDGSEHHYSRSSLMTFAFIEIFRQAIAQINSIRYRELRGDVDCKRYIRNVIVTCPTAMPVKEQVFLRQSAVDAYDAISLCDNNLKPVAILPSPGSLKITDMYADPNKKVWSYDEASCCQLVYLYAEIAERYCGEVNKFFELKGHVRPELVEQGYTNKALTIGTIDIGAGTTDIMVCSYEYEGTGNCKIIPNPLFWDSFYLAGDDILRALVQNVVIEGKEQGDINLGNISSALTARILKMSNEELRSLPCCDNVVYRNKVLDICNTIDEETVKHKKTAFASVLIHDFFGVDSSMMGYKDRRCRNDFNTQVSVPIAQRMMELLRTHMPSRLFTYDELFSEYKPSEYLLNYFEHHFGFRFEELKWRYDPVEIAEIVKSTMEPLMKQLALVLYSQHCDIIVLAGRPTSLDAITELFIKYVPTPPDRLIRLNEYRVGTWFPTADGQGYFYDQKAVVAVGAMVGYLASNAKLSGLIIDFSKMIKKMSSTANYLGEYNSRRQQVTTTLLSPTRMSESLTASVFPVYIGCRQFDSSMYQARPLYAIYNRGNSTTLTIRLSRVFNEDKERLVIEEATDSEFNNRTADLELVQQSLVDDCKYWLDKGEFELTIK